MLTKTYYIIEFSNLFKKYVDDDDDPDDYDDGEWK